MKTLLDIINRVPLSLVLCYLFLYFLLGCESTTMKIMTIFTVFAIVLSLFKQEEIDNKKEKL